MFTCRHSQSGISCCFGEAVSCLMVSSVLVVLSLERTSQDWPYSCCLVVDGLQVSASLSWLPGNWLVVVGCGGWQLVAAVLLLLKEFVRSETGTALRGGRGPLDSSRSEGSLVSSDTSDRTRLAHTSTQRCVSSRQG